MAILVLTRSSTSVTNLRIAGCVTPSQGTMGRTVLAQPFSNQASVYSWRDASGSFCQASTFSQFSDPAAKHRNFPVANILHCNMLKQLTNRVNIIADAYITFQMFIFFPMTIWCPTKTHNSQFPTRTKQMGTCWRVRQLWIQEMVWSEFDAFFMSNEKAVHNKWIFVESKQLAFTCPKQTRKIIKERTPFWICSFIYIQK